MYKTKLDFRVKSVELCPPPAQTVQPLTARWRYQTTQTQRGALVTRYFPNHSLALQLITRHLTRSLQEMK